MKRTRNRPLPSGRITPAHAAAWGATTGLSSAAILALGCNPLTAVLGVSNIALYACVYTPIKQKSIWNTWIGAVVGAIPPVMGYTAATGCLFAPEALLVSSELFLWQFPHFFALAWMAKKDYAAGGYQMLPVLDPSGARTAAVIQRYSVLMAAVPLLSSAAGVTSSMFAVESLAFNGYLLHLSNQFRKDRSHKNAQALFRCSLWYLPLVMSLMVYHHTPQQSTSSSSASSSSSAVLATASTGAAAAQQNQQQQQQEQAFVNTAQGFDQLESDGSNGNEAVAAAAATQAQAAARSGGGGACPITSFSTTTAAPRDTAPTASELLEPVKDDLRSKCIHEVIMKGAGAAAATVSTVAAGTTATAASAGAAASGTSEVAAAAAAAAAAPTLSSSPPVAAAAVYRAEQQPQPSSSSSSLSSSPGSSVMSVFCPVAVKEAVVGRAAETSVATAAAAVAKK